MTTETNIQNQHGGSRLGAGRKSTGRKKQIIYVTDEELAEIKELIEHLRSAASTKK